VKIGTEAAQFPEKEYIHGIFLAVLHRLAETHQQKNVRISIDIVTIIGYRIPEAQIGRGLEAVCSSIAKDNVTIIGCYRPEVHGDPLHIKTACCHTYHRSGATPSQLEPNFALE
jgi:hypothetical protein